jgi:hypothetical protein
MRCLRTVRTALPRSGKITTPASSKTVADVIEADQPLVINLLYGDFEGGQRIIIQFALRPASEHWLAGDQAFQRGPARSSLATRQLGLTEAEVDPRIACRIRLLVARGAPGERRILAGGEQ